MMSEQTDWQLPSASAKTRRIALVKPSLDYVDSCPLARNTATCAA